MHIKQGSLDSEGNWSHLNSDVLLKNPLVLIFANRYVLEDEAIFNIMRDLFPDGHLIFGSTAGEILGSQVNDGGLAYTAIEFEKSSFNILSENILNHSKDAVAAGKALGLKVNKEGLKHIFVISEGSFVNGSELIKGIESVLPDEVAITGGLCGDDARFNRTLAGYNKPAAEGEIIGIALYGQSLEISFANYGGWFPFGPERIITKSKGNVLYELDHKPALDLYKSYLGDKAAELPTSSLFYPLSVQSQLKERPLVRTILTIDEAENTMILAGDVPEGSKVKLMMATVDGIIDGACEAAKEATKNRKTDAQLAILVSCVGRKLVMHQRVEEEVEEVIEVIGKQAVVSGFYSYGEMAPFSDNNQCELHNQTMTLTLISE
ncbi:MAG: FIST C-terminal domain-containing protein [Leeuwenhoekiella sp.]|nr:FIST C-terminal domain-containing protein [Leeuwenhoekiella sp.]